MKPFNFTIFDIQPNDPLIDLIDECNFQHFIIQFDIEEVGPDQECGEILEKIYGISTNITKNEDMENTFTVDKNDYQTKYDLVKYLESVGGKYIV